jgi:hypothetical protein
MAERDGCAVVCGGCKGTGRSSICYTPWTGKKKRDGITWVIKCNPGICVAPHLDIGGMPFDSWESGLTFPRGSEMREYVCPAWWCQCADYDKKPDWSECIAFGAFSGCDSFDVKAVCWERWDRENP